MLTIEQVAELTKTSVKRVRHDIAAGVLPSIKCNNRYYVNPEDIKNYKPTKKEAYPMRCSTKRDVVNEGLRSMLGGRVEQQIITDYKNICYDINVTVLNSADYGGPQIRKRVIFLVTESVKTIFTQSLFWSQMSIKPCSSRNKQAIQGLCG